MALLALPFGLWAVHGASSIDKTLETTPNPRISVSNLRGAVVVRGWNKREVHAVCTASSTQVEIDTEAMPAIGQVDKIHFSTHVLDPQVSEQDEAADYTLEIPAGSTLEIHNPEGTVTVEGIRGDDWVDSVGGKISVSDAAGHLAVRSIGGDIEIIRPSGRVEASSVTGNLDFKACASSKLRAITTGSGNIHYQGDFAPAGDYVLSSYRGDVDILCPASDSFELNARTVRGSVNNQFPLTPKRHSALSPSFGHSLVGTHNSGAATVELTSFSGTIWIRPQP
ncbi:MAG TPA: DUF4097 family beta strand repeat-containing protein [Terriglobia bacterium]|nr:DUF4097 family beta strand repeat-containing protein [Terriglobia bacterium]